MPPTTEAVTEISLTARHIDEWPHTSEPLALVARWAAGRSAAFSTPPLERAVPVCRELARLWLDAERIHDPIARYTVLLVLSELLTNAMRHSESSRVRGRLRRAGDLVRVTVRDQGGGPSVPRLSRADGGTDHGRGLLLVAASAEDWGSRLDAEGGCTVWAAVPITAPEKH